MMKVIPPLHWSAWRNVYEAEELSLENRTGVNPREKSGYTLLHWAVWRRRL